MALWRNMYDDPCCGDPFPVGDEAPRVRWKRGHRRTGTGVPATPETPGGPASARPGE
ncbi:hypothetical protein [Streptomyces sp. NPDC054887]